MSRRYSSGEQRLVLDRLIVNGGDVARTARQTGISERTIHRWRKQAHLTLTALTPLPPTPPQKQPVSPQPDSDQPAVAPPADPLDPFIPSMIAEANYLLGSIRDVVDDAPLHQRVIALVQIIDRIERLDYRAQVRASRLNAPEELSPWDYEIRVAHHVEKEDDLDEGFPEPGYISAWPTHDAERQASESDLFPGEEPVAASYTQSDPGF